ncbi:MAG: MGH1-like glycoside hydrolase domain-containing protein [Phycisphaerae bacterium]
MKFRTSAYLPLLLLASCTTTPPAPPPTAAPPTPTTYDRLADHQQSPLGPKTFLSNLKWFAEETDDHLALTFRTMPRDQAEAEYVALTQIVGSSNKVASFPSARRTLFQLRLPDTDQIREITYRPDALTARTPTANITRTLPLDRFGAILQITPTHPAQPLEIHLDPATILGPQLVSPAPLQIFRQQHTLTWTQGNYTLVFRFNGTCTASTQTGATIQSPANTPLLLTAAFHINSAKALQTANQLFTHAPEEIARSRHQWTAFLDSCPITHFPHGFHAHDPATNRDVDYTDDELTTRQLWHWQTALANCYDVPFNNMPAQLCPDKTTWFGSWSNDTPAALAALARTNQKPFVRRALIDFVRTGILPGGDLSWYMHGTGVPGLGNPHDVGRLSHGVPEIVTAIADYIRATGDTSILNAPAADHMTVYQNLKIYMTNVFHRRKTSLDGLIAWANLWEGGADDKVGPFFSKADITTWCNAVEHLNDADLQHFYAENDRPVINLYEQAFFLHALQSLAYLADRARDKNAAIFATEEFNHIAHILHDKNWDDHDGFYYDTDLTTRQLVHEENQDAFYLLRYLPNDPARTGKLVAHLYNPDEFGLPCLPTLAKNQPGFKADGYWCGGYWPREAAPIAYALAAVGHKQDAEVMLVKALMCARGRTVLENVNPLTGEPSTPIKTMAYSVQLNTALHDIHNAP